MPAVTAFRGGWVVEVVAGPEYLSCPVCPGCSGAVGVGRARGGPVRIAAQLPRCCFGLGWHGVDRARRWTSARSRLLRSTSRGSCSSEVCGFGLDLAGEYAGLVYSEDVDFRGVSVGEEEVVPGSRKQSGFLCGQDGDGQ